MDEDQWEKEFNEWWAITTKNLNPMPLDMEICLYTYLAACKKMHEKSNPPKYDNNHEWLADGTQEHEQAMKAWEEDKAKL